MPAPEVHADRGGIAAGRDIRAKLINLGLDEEAIASLMSGMEARLLAAIADQPATREAKAAGVEARAFVLLARKINVAVEDETQALAELEQVVAKLARSQEAAERGSNFDALVDEALRRVAEKARHGEFDEAAAEAGRAFDQWHEHERERRERERADGLRLVKANIEQHRFLRDAAKMALWIQRGLAIEADAAEAPLVALEPAYTEWWKRGIREGLNLDLEVAAELAGAALGRSGLTPDDRGKWKGHLGNALFSLGKRGAEAERLEEAITAHLEALRELARDRVPLQWASAQHSLGNALAVLGESETGTARLQEAVAAYRAALLERQRERVPYEWAATQCSLGNALKALGEREAGTTRLKEAVAAYHAALEEWRRDHTPVDWAMTQANLGAVLTTLGEREEGTVRLEEAVAAYCAALEEWTREHGVLDRASLQAGLGWALTALGEREPGTARLKEAVAVLRTALVDLAPERLPLAWAGASLNLGNALQALGVSERRSALLEEAVVSYRAALDERTRERGRLDWATTQNNLGNALRVLGSLEAGTARLEQAVGAYRAALEERTRDCVPLDWAATTLSLCMAEALIAERLQQPDGLAALEQQAGEARAVLVAGGHERGAGVGNYVLREIARIRAALDEQH